jgi:DNA-binding transcriptional MerR regulator
MLQTPAVPDKEYFSIGEVSQITQVEQYTLRYWEDEFKLLRPLRHASGKRRYRKADVELIFKIKDLLHNQGYRIEGVKKFLNAGRRKKLTDPELNISLEKTPDSKFLKDLKQEITDILALLKKV